jgi:toxin ParE1/3/4
MNRLPLVLEPEAEADLLDAFEWYERQRTGLGHEFIDCVDDVLERISESPQLYAPTYCGVRQAFVRRFPYVVCFLIEADNISVIAVMHGRQDPREWQSRLR